jgi:hypothetical protein
VDDDTWVNPPNLAALVDGPLLANASFVGFGPVGGAPVAYGGAGYFLSKAAQQALLRPANFETLTDAGRGGYTGYHLPGERFEEVLRFHVARTRQPQPQGRRRRHLAQAAGGGGGGGQPWNGSSADSGGGGMRRPRQEAGAKGLPLLPGPEAGDRRPQQQQSWIQACAAAKAGGPWCYFHSDWAVADCVRLATGGAVTPLTHVGGRRCSKGFGAGFGLHFMNCPPSAGHEHVTCHYVSPEDMLQRELALCAAEKDLPGCVIAGDTPRL